MNFKKDFLAFVNEKFGSAVVESFLPNTDFLKLEPLADSAKQNRQNEVKSHLRTIAGSIGLPENSLETRAWAFDFPGWQGELGANDTASIREIMVIGMEPHIQDVDIQVTYGADLPAEKLRGGRLWERLFPVFKKDDEADGSKFSTDFLERFYTTDLCHFAPKGNAKLIGEIAQWSSIREQVAARFLLREIELVKPQIIVSQGVKVGVYVDNSILKTIGKPVRWKPTNRIPHSEHLVLPTSKYKNVPALSRFELYNGMELVHVILPHIGTGQTSSFWKEDMMEALRNEIASF